MYVYTPVGSTRLTFPFEGDLQSLRMDYIEGADGDLYGLSSGELDGFHIVDPGADSDAFGLDRDELGDYLGDLYQEADQEFADYLEISGTTSPMNVTPNMMPKKNTVGVAIAQLRNAFGQDDKKQKRGKERRETNNGWTKA